MLTCKHITTGIIMAFLPLIPVFSQASDFDVTTALEAHNISWDVPGPSSAESMPIGNGDIGLNVWVETNGDLVFYVGKTDAWNEDIKGSNGLLKLGKVRVSMNPGPLVAGASFLQTLKLHEGEIQIKEGVKGNEVLLRVWVDANNPVIRVEMRSSKALDVKVSLENWRPASDKDVILNESHNRIVWYHRNGTKADPHLANLTFGAEIKGDHLKGVNESTLEAKSVNSQLISIFPLTATTSTPAEWIANLERKVQQTEKLKLEQTRTKHQEWWAQFWNRSWIFAKGDKAADDIITGYILQRFITACGGRGAYPIKFNGSIFNVDNPSMPDGKDKDGNIKPPRAVTADFRRWGGQYWFQNTRPMYWPCLMAGDFDCMRPLFDMYAKILPDNAAQVKSYYKHEGSYFAETAPFYGGLKYVGPEMPENWTDHYFTPILELSMMMLDYYEYTGDKKFAKETLLPVAAAGITFFDKHFGRDAHGKILFDPDNAIEMYWKVRNPAPDIAGLQAILPRMLALPEDITDAGARTNWKRMIAELPELPVGIRNKKKMLLPYEGPQTAKRRNGENPELYAIYPFRIYGLEKPDLELAKATFNGRSCKQKGCWVQDPVQAAMLGLPDVAKEYVHFAFTAKDSRLKFPAFWRPANDYEPDQDNGGNGENGLQQMVMQCEGKKILLLPAWPKEWSGEFKLNAPYNTTVQGKVENGKLVSYVVTPSSRKTDVIDESSLFVVSPVTPTGNSNNGNIKNILVAQDSIKALKQTVKGQPGTLAEGNEAESVAAILDGNVNTKYINRSQDKDGLNPKGVNSGFVVVPANNGEPVNAIQFATANDMPDRDPVSITIEGSNDVDADKEGGLGFKVLYEGTTGLIIDPGRKQWGPVLTFSNAKIYKTYRILITETRGDSVDATQYSEVKLGRWISN